jgi:hypothetical protein
MLDGVVEDIAIAVLRDLRMEHADNILEALESDLSLVCCWTVAATAA